MRSLIALSLVLLCAAPVVAQEPPAITTYKKLLKEANDLYTAKDYVKSAARYEKAIAVVDENFPVRGKQLTINPHYNAACCYSLAGQTEKAVGHFAKALEAGFKDWDHIKKDTDLNSIRETAGFKAAIAKAKAGAGEEHDKAEGLPKGALSKGAMFPFKFELPSIIDPSKTLSLAALKGKVVIVDVWGTWCPPCRAELPHFIELQKRYKGDLVIIGLNKERGIGAEAAAMVRKFMKANGINYDCAMISPEVQGQIPNFAGYPTTLMIDRQGRVRRKLVGLQKLAVLEGTIQALIAEKGAEAAPEAAPKKDDDDEEGPF